MRSVQRQTNVRSGLRRRKRRGDAMAAYDRLPSELRAWLMQAVLPWSAHSALRAWHKSLRACGGDAEEAKRHLTRLEQKTLQRDRAYTSVDCPPPNMT
ncbi:DUF6525 family protein [Celeribacter sp.]|uniref:DUF6525 family protein n=1 Tax=Celeribacter sp. TaxID=1890673 RepID=UPI003A8DFF12